MATRTEFEKTIWVAGQEARLFVSSGPMDDYLEMVLPDGVGQGSPSLFGLEELGSNGGLDVQLLPGNPDLLCITALYLNAPEQRTAPESERIEAILSDVAAAIPEIDFGDLLPARQAPPTRDEAPAQVEADAGHRPVAPARTRYPDPLLLRARSRKVEKARTLASAGQTAKAIRLLEESPRGSSGDPEAESLLSAIKLLERREKRLRKEPGSLQANLEVGFSYLILERNQEAARALDRTSRLGPNVYLAHLLHGIALHRLGQVAPARSAYLRAGRLRPGDHVHADLMAALEKGEPPAGLMETGPLSTSTVYQAPTAPRRLVSAG